MAAPAAVMGDRATGICAIHQMPGPLGNPQPAPPMPFSAPLTLGLAMTVLIGGKPAAVVGSTGLNTPPHVGLHPADPFMLPPMQQASVVTGSPTVLFEGRPAASSTSSCTMCAGAPAVLVGSAVTVMIG